MKYLLNFLKKNLLKHNDFSLRKNDEKSRNFLLNNFQLIELFKKFVLKLT